ncbi:hypothetical protein N7481_011066 [Penicillium waksmanii]|uniref:uncharacterized protein n=1 Tax=Penicillium waksmanii TaxID=69791 RepID=UPI00254733AE|nr:uncharacterized protein N7481_011066 [Penicillium waksmanii]KAJ5973856.1 hypothetical protein N7481_011066 [Penicillium waksmanii]
MPQLPYWQLPEFSRDRSEEQPLTWRVAFLLPLEDTERDLFMKRLVVVDNLENWPDRPVAQPRRLLDVPWLFDFTPDSSIISAIFEQGGNEPLIIIDEQSKMDDTAILLYRSEGQDDHRILRAPINRANLLLSAAAEGTIDLKGEDFQPLGYDTPAIMKQGKQNVQELWPVFVIEAMTPEEFERLRSYAEERMVDQYEYSEWFHVAEKLESPDMKGLLAWFESPDFDFDHPPPFFLAVDRWSLEVADDEEPITDLWAECIVASEGGEGYYLTDDKEDRYASWHAGYGSDRMDFEDAIIICMNLEQRNRSFVELFHGAEYDHWKALHSWADGTPRFGGFECPEGRAYWPSEEWDS